MRLMSALYKMFYLPLCRAYAKHKVGNNPADPFMCFLWSIHFMRVHGYWPKLRQPRSFEEKVSWRMLFDRDPRWTLLSDKWRVRDLVASRAGQEYLVPILWKGKNPDDIPFDALPEKYVIKTNHGCKYNILVMDKSQLDLRKTKRQLKKWILENYCEDKWLGTEWAYKNIEPVIFIEMFLDDRGNVPLDYKFFCYSGRMEYLQMNFDRFGDATEKFFDRSFTPLDLWNGTKQHEGEVTRPENYEKMVKLAETLAEGCDFIRVDLYCVGGRVYFGELTCYPAGASCEFIPRSFDYIFGEKWILNP